MKEFDFEVKRPMHGDREYQRGDTRSLTATDAVHLVKAGSLEPKGKEAKAAIEKLLADSPDAQIVQEVKSSKDAGDAPVNKADVAEPPAGSAAGAADGQTGAAATDQAASQPAQTAPAAATKADTAKPATGKRR